MRNRCDLRDGVSSVIARKFTLQLLIGWTASGSSACSSWIQHIEHQCISHEIDHVDASQRFKHVSTLQDTKGRLNGSKAQLQRTGMLGLQGRMLVDHWPFRTARRLVNFSVRNGVKFFVWCCSLRGIWRQSGHWCGQLQGDSHHHSVSFEALSTCSSDFRQAFESVKEVSSTFTVVAPEGFFQLWVGLVQAPTAEALHSKPTAAALEILQVCHMIGMWSVTWHSVWVLHWSVLQLSWCQFILDMQAVDFIADEQSLLVCCKVSGLRLKQTAAHQ